jgi:hypothetical protein
LEKELAEFYKARQALAGLDTGFSHSAWVELKI